MCPYCTSREIKSRDHVFPRFLGGHQQIDACKNCNDTFGYSFEAAVANQIGPLQLLLRTCGLPIPREIVWKRFLDDESTGIEWDLRSDLSMRRSKPKLDIDEHGKIKGGIFRDRKEAEKIARDLKRKNLVREFRIEEKTEQRPLNILPPTTTQFHIGTEMRRLTIKMSAALAALLHPEITILSDTARSYLLGANVEVIPVRIAYLPYKPLDDLRPPLAHLVFVEANPDRQLCYGIIQLFGTIQLYAVINDQYGGSKFSSVGILDTIHGTERFEHSVALNLVEAPRFIQQQDVVRGLNGWRQKLLDQIEQALGKDLLKLKIEDLLSRRVFLPGPNIPELINPSSDEFQLPVILVEMSYDVDVQCHLPSEVTTHIATRDLRSHRFSSDGRNTVDFAQIFLDWWKDNTTKKTDYLWHELELPPLKLLLDEEWIPVDALLKYKINKSIKIKYVKAKRVSKDSPETIELEIAEPINIGDATWLNIDDPEAVEYFYAQEASALHFSMTINEQPTHETVQLKVVAV